ncbi:MAG: Holliday junction branch migration protein RuvA [Actinomycetaceae bacterium]|nr:Holliday junction branch migration protein RuvA [Actinomycetaceae bacterium]
MISYLTGQVHALKGDRAVIINGGFGFDVSITGRAASDMRHGAAVELYTSLVVREDSLTLYGFPTEDERDTFELLQTVSGVGPRLALAILDVFTPDDLRLALADKNEKQLQRVPGVGKKSAQRLILEIGDKLGPATAQSKPVAPSSETADEVIAALVNLGWQQSVATRAVADLDGLELSTSDMLRTALVNLGGTRG